ncbi:DUF3718 domain-containing protein [Thalassotalea ponticola]|uniref:DUF3718 domain-containing protein n=1 Tax=Thalassotalea ponticola TaxID=1523392 RepID=UPI0025B3583B|nr:DUF3718 domain-containing protein [Thalassotalea ponticola]MDN3652045.1 DUF3718 domain-containing protein [Thalassotalea ponticola]
MKTLTLVALMTTSMTLSVQANADSTMDPYIESALVQVCKSAQSNDLSDMRSTIKSFRLNEKTVAQNVVCNGDNIINFAEDAGAYKTANHLQQRLGESEITDLAYVYAVTF